MQAALQANMAAANEISANARTAREVGRRMLTLSNSMLKAPTAFAIETIHDELLSNVAYNFSLRCYSEDVSAAAAAATAAARAVAEVARKRRVAEMRAGKAATDAAVSGRGLHSSTFRLNLSAFCGTGGAYRGGLRGDSEVLWG